MTIQPYYHQKNRIEPSVEVVDLLQCHPSKLPFIDRVAKLQLTGALEDKIHVALRGTETESQLKLLSSEEKELATEVLLLRHKFTELVWKHKRFNQAALTVLQNIYLFKNRRIFFDPCGPEYEEERQEALHFFSNTSNQSSLPLAKTFQHLIIARVWNRILSQAGQDYDNGGEMKELLEVVEALNTIRNIYLLLTTGLVKKIVSQMGELYTAEISNEDACQIGSFGVARAAYRYHHSIGIRFSTYAANWIKKEIQRQTLNGRLIRISTNTIEQYAKAIQTGDRSNIERYSQLLLTATCKQQNDLVELQENRSTSSRSQSVQEINFELEDDKQRLYKAIDACLTEKEADIVKRRFGLTPYAETPQSVISISKLYGVTRGSIYQLESKALTILRKALLKLEA